LLLPDRNVHQSENFFLPKKALPNKTLEFKRTSEIRFTNLEISTIFQHGVLTDQDRASSRKIFVQIVTYQ
jgi:hypothetical protein